MQSRAARRRFAGPALGTVSAILALIFSTITFVRIWRFVERYEAEAELVKLVAGAKASTTERQGENLLALIDSGTRSASSRMDLLRQEIDQGAEERARILGDLNDARAALGYYRAQYEEQKTQLFKLDNRFTDAAIDTRSRLMILEDNP